MAPVTTRRHGGRRSSAPSSCGPARLAITSVRRRKSPSSTSNHRERFQPREAGNAHDRRGLEVLPTQRTDSWFQRSESVCPTLQQGYPLSSEVQAHLAQHHKASILPFPCPRSQGCSFTEGNQSAESGLKHEARAPGGTESLPIHRESSHASLSRSHERHRDRHSLSSRRPAVLLWRCYGPIVDTTQHPASGHSSRTTAVPSSRLVEPFRVYVIETSSRVSEPLMSSH